MSILTQGTQIYFIDPEGNTSGDGPAVVEVECATTFSPGGTPADQIEDTCLAATAKSFMAGLRTPGQASLGLNADPKNDSHLRIFELHQEDPSPTVGWFVGWSDGSAPPTVDAQGEVTLPTTRTWFSFKGYVADFPFDFAGNTVVQSTVSIQRSGVPSWDRKTGA